MLLPGCFFSKLVPVFEEGRQLFDLLTIMLREVSQAESFTIALGQQEQSFLMLQLVHDAWPVKSWRISSSWIYKAS